MDTSVSGKVEASTIKPLSSVSNDNDIKVLDPTQNGVAKDVMEVDLTKEDDKNNGEAANVSSPLRGTIKLRSIASLCDSQSPKKQTSSSKKKNVKKIAPKPVSNVGEILTVADNAEVAKKVPDIIDKKSSDLAKSLYADAFNENSKKARQSVVPHFVMHPYQNEKEIGETIIGLNVFRSVTEMKNLCLMCSVKKTCRCVIVDVNSNGRRSYQFLCSLPCCTEFEKSLKKQKAGPPVQKRTCAQCYGQLKMILKQDAVIRLQKHEFCSQTCITAFVKNLGADCFRCCLSIKEADTLKYATSFGSQTRQFCSYFCIQVYTTDNTFCLLCHEVNDQTKVQKPVETGFCGWRCVRRKNQIDNGQANYRLKNHCTICQKFDVNLFKFYAQAENAQPILLCSQQCVSVFAYLKKLDLGHCGLCSMMVDSRAPSQCLFTEGKQKIFCSDSCFSIYVIGTRKIVRCLECMVMKFDYDMISIAESKIRNFFCSLNCMTKHGQTSSNTSNGDCPTQNANLATLPGVDTCALCSKEEIIQCHMVMSDSSMRSFCSYDCAMEYKIKFGYIVEPQNIDGPIAIESVETSSAKEVPDIAEMAEKLKNSLTTLKPKEMCNKSVSCNFEDAPCKSKNTDAESSSSDHVFKPVYIPVPVPIFVPTPMMMYSANVPVPLTIPIPVPFPVVLPTTEKTSEDIFKHIKEIMDSKKLSDTDKNSNSPCVTENEVNNVQSVDANSNVSGDETSADASEISTNTKSNEESSNGPSEISTNIESSKDERLKESEELEASSAVESPPKEMAKLSQNKRKLSVSDDENEEPNKRSKSDGTVADITNNKLQVLDQ